MRKPKPSARQLEATQQLIKLDEQTTLHGLTKAGKPRLRAPGAGAPDKGRKTYLSRVSAECLADFKTLATAWECSIADAIERAAAQAVKRLPPTSPAHKKS